MRDKVLNKIFCLIISLISLSQLVCADSLKCVSHYTSFKNKVKYAENDSYTEILMFERDKEQTIKSSFNGKPITKQVVQDVVDGQTSGYSNINNSLVRRVVTISQEKISSSYYAQDLKPLDNGQLGKEIRTAELTIDRMSGEMSRTSSVQTQNVKYLTISSGICTPID